MATIFQHTADVPAYDGPPIPGLKPPIREPLYSEAGHPEEADAFNELIREIRGKAPKLDK